MRIGIDFYAFDPVYSGGVNTFALGLLEGLLANANEIEGLTLFVSKDNEVYLREITENRNIQIHLIPKSRLSDYINKGLTLLAWIVRDYRVRYWYERLFRRKINKQIQGAVDAIIVPTTVSNFYDLNIPTILCIHDIQQEYYPENFSLRQRIARWAPYRLSCDIATIIQVSSLYIKECLLEKFPFLLTRRFLVVPEGVDRNKFSNLALDQEPQSLPVSVHQQFVYYPAQIWRHKNHELLMYALARFRTIMGIELPCVLTGYDYGYWSEIDKLRSKLNLKAVFYLGVVDLPEVIWLYRNCQAVLALGLHESSSLPVREGASFGKPLICADIQPNIEAATYLHLNLFIKNSPESLVEKLLNECVEGYSVNAAKRNTELISSLDWKVIARKYIKKLQESSNIN